MAATASSGESSRKASFNPSLLSTPNQDLAHFLDHAQTTYAYNFDDVTKTFILSRCYEALWLNDPQLISYFFNDPDTLSRAIRFQLETSAPHSSDTNTPVLWHTNRVLPPPDLESQHGLPCRHVFRKGEAVYRCR